MLAGLLLANSAAFDSSSTGVSPPETDLVTPPSLHVVASAYGSVGSYTTDTRSKSASAYITLSNEWRDYYTVGFASLWLERDDMGGKYYSQQLLAGRGSWLLDPQTNLFGVYAYLHESEIVSYSSSASFHLLGGGGSYWFSLTEVAGGAIVASTSQGKLQSGAARGFFSFHLTEGVWLTSAATYTKAQWTPSMFVFRQSVSVPLGGENHLVASADIGRRAFFFDDDLLIVYNQRSVQTGSYVLKGTIRVFDHFYVIPLLQYDTFDDYQVKYGSLGLRVVY